MNDRTDANPLPGQLGASAPQVNATTEATGTTEANAANARRPGRHRSSTPRPRAIRHLVTTAVASAVMVALWGVFAGVGNLTGRDGVNTANPAAAPPDRNATNETGNTGTTEGAGTTGSTEASSTTIATPSPSVPKVPSPWTARGYASYVLAVAEGKLATADPGALIVAANFGQNVDTRPVVVDGAWGSKKLPNGLTLAQNNTRALRAGKLTGPAQLPQATTTTRVVVSKTDQRRLPVQSAQATFTQLVNTEGPACEACTPITVTAVRPTTMQVSTTVGRLTVPAWSFAVAGSKATIVAPALAPTALINPGPDYRGATPAQLDKAQLPLWRHELSADGLVVTAYIDTNLVRSRGGCWRLFRSETDTAVAMFAAPGTGAVNAPCASSIGKVTMRMSSPLGKKTLLDTYWQRALVP